MTNDKSCSGYELNYKWRLQIVYMQLTLVHFIMRFRSLEFWWNISSKIWILLCFSIASNYSLFFWVIHIENGISKGSKYEDANQLKELVYMQNVGL